MSRRRAVWYIYDVRLSRHSRTGLLAVSTALVVWLLPLPGSEPAPVIGPDGAGAAVATPALAIPPPGPSRDPAPPADRWAGDLTPPPPASLTGYQWPLPRGRLTLPFAHSKWGSRLVDGLPFHDGIDLATFCGDRIVAAHSGTVLAAGRRFDAHMGWQGDLGPYEARLDEKGLWGTLPIVLVIDDGNGYRSVYAHFRQIVVGVGERVEAGQLIGYEGDTGRASGCHLHYGLFSPLETAVFEIMPEVVERMKVPQFQTARIDPLLVLPPRPTPTPDPTPTPEPPAFRGP